MTDEEYAAYISTIFESDEVATLAASPKMVFGDAQDFFKRTYNVDLPQEVWDKHTALPKDDIGLQVILEVVRSLASRIDETLAAVAVRFAPQWSVNAQIVINPTTRRPVVLLNQGVVCSIQLALNVYSAITRKRSSFNLAAFSYHQLFDELIQVASIAVNGAEPSCDIRQIAKTMLGAEDGNFNSGVVRLCFLTEVFLVLHELAHIHLGHVPRINIDVSVPADAEAVHLIDRSLQKEIEADLCAINWLANMKAGDGLSPDEAVLVLGLYLHFANLCSMVDQRPSLEGFQQEEYLARWHAAKQFFRIEQFHGFPVWDLDAWFSQIHCRVSLSSADHAM